jgi:hypothetical protein
MNLTPKLRYVMIFYRLVKSYISLFFVLISCLFFPDSKVFGQPNENQQSILPHPSGEMGIGRLTFDWLDTTRIEPFTSGHQYRELSVDIWYPAEVRTGTTAHYLNVNAFDKALDTTGLKSLVGVRAANLIRSGKVRTHAIEGAPIAYKIKTAPILIFSHGMGMITQLYTAQIEDLVSHGYIVVAINHPYDAWLTLYNDGRSVPFEWLVREAANKTEEEQIAYENKRVDWWANDIRFVLNKLTSLNQNFSDEIPFAGHLDLQRIGAFGHSAGGRAAARACQLDHRLCACVDQDGVVMFMPFYVNKQGFGMNQPFLLINRETSTPPSDDDLQQMKLTRQEVFDLVKKLKAKRDSALSATGGSIRIVLTFEKTNHMSFSDLPLLQAETDSEAESCKQILGVINRYTREFFDRVMLGIKAPLFEGTTKLEFIDSVKYYSPLKQPY